jgi:hypothetical protein
MGESFVNYSERSKTLTLIYAVGILFDVNDIWIFKKSNGFVPFIRIGQGERGNPCGVSDFF